MPKPKPKLTLARETTALIALLDDLVARATECAEKAAELAARAAAPTEPNGAGTAVTVAATTDPT
jgi:hypothetical protein